MSSASTPNRTTTAAIRHSPRLAEREASDSPPKKHQRTVQSSVRSTSTTSNRSRRVTIQEPQTTPPSPPPHPPTPMEIPYDQHGGAAPPATLTTNNNLNDIMPSVLFPEYNRVPEEQAASLYSLYYKPIPADDEIRTKLATYEFSDKEPCVFDITFHDIICGPMVTRTRRSDRVSKPSCTVRSSCGVDGNLICRCGQWLMA
jgi:hypothetical protein